MLTDLSRLILDFLSLAHSIPKATRVPVPSGTVGPLVSPTEAPLFRSVAKHMGKAICYIIVASDDVQDVTWYTKRLLRMYKKGESGAFKSRACRRNAHKVRTMFVAEKQRRKRISKINVNVLTPKGNHDYEMRDDGCRWCANRDLSPRTFSISVEIIRRQF